MILREVLRSGFLRSRTAGAGASRYLSRSVPSLSETNELGIPKNPTWSVHKLISSYPRPRISPELLTKLHSLSALIPPSEGTPEHAKLTREMEELVRLVEAVKLVDVSAEDTHDGVSVPDGRIWPDDVGIPLSSNTRDVEYELDDGETGQALLKHATRTKDGFYVVDTDRRKR